MTADVLHVLVIEDDEDIATMIAVTLRRAGFDVTVAHDGERGLLLAGEMSPDVVLLDLMMAPTDGFEVLARLSTDPVTATIPVVVASILEAEDRARKLGARAFVRKPFVPGAVAATLREVAATA